MKKNSLLPLIPVCLVLTGTGTEIEDDDHECTSWIVMPELTGGKSMMIHKNRDASSDRLQLYKSAEPGKNSWISISNLNSKMAYAGLNDKGLAVAMNSGDPTEFFSALKQKIDHHDLGRDLDAHRQEIQQMIEQDIVSAYYYQAGQMQVGLRTDKTLREAERILTTAGEYEKLLGTAQKSANEQLVDKNPAVSVK